MTKLHAALEERVPLRMHEEGKLPAEHAEDKAALIQYGLRKYRYYKCYSCSLPYFGGAAACDAAADAAAAPVRPEELVCPACLPGAADQVCAKHGSDFVEW